MKINKFYIGQVFNLGHVKCRIISVSHRYVTVYFGRKYGLYVLSKKEIRDFLK